MNKLLQHKILLGSRVHTSAHQAPEAWRGKADLEDYHHYWAGPYASQYCSFQRKEKNKKQWMALHHQEHHAPIRTLCKYIEYSKKTYSVFADMDITFYFPVIVLAGELHLITQHGSQIEISSVNHVQFLQSVSQKSAHEDYLIDVVTESHLPTLLDAIGTDVATASARIFPKQE